MASLIPTAKFLLHENTLQGVAEQQTHQRIGSYGAEPNSKEFWLESR